MWTNFWHSDRWYTILGVDSQAMYRKVGMERYHYLYAELTAIERLVYWILGF